MYTYLFVDSKSQHILHVEVCSGAQIAEKSLFCNFEIFRKNSWSQIAIIRISNKILHFALGPQSR